MSTELMVFAVTFSKTHPSDSLSEPRHVLTRDLK